MEAVHIEKSKFPSAVIASIPHGSSKITSDMRESMMPDVILTNNDWFLNDLYSFLSEINITKVSANYSRYVIDVNRNINKEQIRGGYTESLVYQRTTFGKEIYRRVLSREVIKDRIRKYYEPYHYHLIEQINNSLKVKGKAYLFDLHSFYAQSAADIVLGTQDGTTCSDELLNIVYQSFISENFSVAVNEKGLRGGFIVSNYSSMENVEAIQIEIRYTAYIEDRYFGEEEIIYRDNQLFSQTQKRLKRVFKNIIGEIKGEFYKVFRDI